MDAGKLVPESPVHCRSTDVDLISTSLQPSPFFLPLLSRSFLFFLCAKEKMTY